MRRVGLRALLCAVLFALLLSFGSTGARADFINHGISLAKGCNSTTEVGSAVVCTFTVRNNIDDAGDSMTISSLIDTQHAFNGDQASANIITAGQLTTTSLATSGTQTGSVCYASVRRGSDLSATNGSATVTSASANFSAADAGRKIDIDGTPYTIASVTNATTAVLSTTYGASNGAPTATGLSWIIGFKDPSQDGTGAHPYTGSGFCELPANSRVNVLGFGHYTVQAGDFGLANHKLFDSASLNWNDECNGLAAGPPPGGGNCNSDPPAVAAGSSTTVTARPSSTATTIHDASHNTATAVAVNTQVHDFVAVTTSDPSGSQPIPSGNVKIDWFTGTSASPCTTLVTTSASIALGPNGTVDATGFPQTPTGAGYYGFKAHYLGDTTYAPSDGACEPLQVVDADIQISPPTATNRIGQTHTFTAQVNVNSGSGFGPAPDGTSISFTLDSGNGSFTSPNPCTTSGGSCQITFVSTTTGVSTVSAHTTVSVAGVSVHRDTDGTGLNSGPAHKTWVDAKISIAPSATNRIGQPHTFTVTLMKDTGTGTFVPAAGETVTVTLTPSNGASPNPAGPFTGTTDGNGRYQVTFTSQTTCTVSAHASSTLAVNGSAPFTVQTDGSDGSSNDAVKTFVDAKISIAPSATNEVGQPHTFTVTLLKDTGTGTFVPAAGEHVDVTLTPSNGATLPNPATGGCTTAGANTNASGQCTITFSSPTAGKVTGHASSTLQVNGSAPFTVQTDGSDGSSNDAVKTYVDAAITLTPSSALNEVGHPHTFTAHVTQNDGTGTGPAPNGTVVSFTASPPPATVDPTCTITNGLGTCDVQVNSSTASTVTVHATTTFSVGGVSLTRSTGDGKPGDSADATKYFVDANVSVLPQKSTNEVTNAHVFTITSHALTQPGVTATLGSITPNVSPAGAQTGTTCGSPDTSTPNQATCTVTVNSSTPATITIGATALWHFSDGPDQVDVTRTTGGALNTAAGGSGSATKYFVDANVSVSPPTSLNEVNNGHTFTITSHALTQPGVTATLGSMTPNVSPAGAQTGTTCGSPDTSTPNQATCTVTVNSSSPATVTIGATAVWHFNDGTNQIDVTRTTGGALNTAAGGSGPATKYFVDANVSVTPPTSLNEVTNAHVFTITSHALTQSGVTATLGSLTPNVAPAGAQTGTTCGAPDTSTPNQATCTVTVNSSTPATVTIGATAVWHFSDGPDQVDVTRTTGSGLNTAAGGSGPATKRFVDANVLISPNSVNEVNNAHTFTITSNALGQPGATATLTSITPIVSPAGAQTGTTCGSPDTSTPNTATCTVTVNSSTATIVTVGATAVWHFSDGTNQIDVTRTTGGALNTAAGGTGASTKTFVDANITIAPQTADNPVGTNHTLTGHVGVNPGTGFVDAPNGTVITFSLTNSGGATAVFVGGINQCTVSNGLGSCTVQITSNTPGTTTINASTNINVLGVMLTRDTDPSTLATAGPGGSGPATKNWHSVGSNSQTHQAYIPQDTATVTGYNPTGSVTFELYQDSSNCTGTPKYSQTVPLNGNGSAATTNSGDPGVNNGFTATGNHTWFWKVTYPGDANNKSSTSCSESSTITEP